MTLRITCYGLLLDFNLKIAYFGYMSATPQTTIDTFKNPHPERDYEIQMECPEFTCLCPLTGQPDFAQIFLCYVPDQFCVELKSLKMYLWHFRDRGAFHEAVTNEIANLLLDTLKPRRLEVKAVFGRRGGIDTNVIVRFPDK